MSNEDLMMMTSAFVVGAISSYLVIYKDNLVAIGNLLFVCIMIAILVGLVGIAFALGFVGVVVVFIFYMFYLVYLRIKAQYRYRKRG